MGKQELHSRTLQDSFSFHHAKNSFLWLPFILISMRFASTHINWTYSHFTDLCQHVLWCEVCIFMPVLYTILACIFILLHFSFVLFCFLFSSLSPPPTLFLQPFFSSDSHAGLNASLERKKNEFDSSSTEDTDQAFVIGQHCLVSVQLYWAI